MAKGGRGGAGRGVGASTKSGKVLGLEILRYLSVALARQVRARNWGILSSPFLQVTRPETATPYAPPKR